MVAGDRVAIALPAARDRDRSCRDLQARRDRGAADAAFGSDALGVRLRGSEPAGIIAERGRSSARPTVRRSIDVDQDLEGLLAAASADFTAAATTPDTPALLVYTSGTGLRVMPRLTSSGIHRSVPVEREVEWCDDTDPGLLQRRGMDHGPSLGTDARPQDDC